MSDFELILIAIGLSMDAFAVSVCKGLSTKNLKTWQMFVTSTWFGIFQALMPLIGYLLGSALEGVISQRLVKKLCPKCRSSRPATEYEKNVFTVEKIQ